jgi:hypothetical protein
MNDDIPLPSRTARVSSLGYPRRGEKAAGQSADELLPRDHWITSSMKGRSDLSVQGRSGQATGGPPAPGDAGHRLHSPHSAVPRASRGTPSAQ